jgi:hypothetical protein
MDSLPSPTRIKLCCEMQVPSFGWNAMVSTVLPGTLIHTVRGVGYLFALPVEPLRRWYPDKLRPTSL